MAERLAHIIDDDPQIRDSLAFMLSAEGIDSTRHDCADAFLATLPDLHPGCILLDLRMPGMPGQQLQKHLHAKGCRMPVIIITGHGDIASAVTAMKEGAIDFIQKPFSRQDLLAALDAAWSALAHPAPSADERMHAEALITQLTPREHDVLAGLVKGHPNKVIAFDLDISPRTVELYRANAMRKLNARSLSEMLHIAFLAGMNGKAI